MTLLPSDIPALALAFACGCWAGALLALALGRLTACHALACLTALACWAGFAGWAADRLT